ncbi:MAG: chemotaxis protein CheD [Spirochaetales bacterium]|nr:chemotaxis protein CheD [Spirochaetales bacterium]
MDSFNVGIGDYDLAAGEGVLATVLGSCVGVILYDKAMKIGGLAHVYLPDSRIGLRSEPKEPDNLLGRSLKYADLLIPTLVDEMIALGAEPRRMFAYVVGGAMLADFPEDSSLNVGLRNLERTREILREMGLRFVEVKVGGRSGRKVTFDVGTGDLRVKEYSGIGDRAT